MTATLTKEQIKQLKPLEKHLYTAYKSGFTTGLYQKDVILAFSIYNEAYKANETNYGCSSCQINVFKRLGSLYFSIKETVKEDKPSNKTKKTGKNGTKKSKTKD